jgi:hypothetical protein
MRILLPPVLPPPKRTGCGPVDEVGANPTGVVGPDTGCPPTGLMFALFVLGIALGIVLGGGGF